MSRWSACLPIALLLTILGCDDSRADRSAPLQTLDSRPGASKPATQSASATQSAPRAMEAVSNAGKYFVSVTTHPSPIPDNELFELDLYIAAAAHRDKPLTDIDVRVDAQMPEHQHGMVTQPNLVRVGDHFRVEGMQFHMSGHWELYVDISAGGETERAQFRIEMP